MIIKLATVFNGRPAPGGEFNTETATYTKLCRARNGGWHPHRYEIGGIDAPIISQLRAYQCQQIEMQTSQGIYRISFEKFLQYGKSQQWNDTRFPYPRWYAPAQVWESESLVRHEAPSARAEQAQQQQVSLFDQIELQDLALSGRLAR